MVPASIPDSPSYVTLLVFSLPQLFTIPPNTSTFSVRMGTVRHTARSGTVSDRHTAKSETVCVRHTSRSGTVSVRHIARSRTVSVRHTARSQSGSTAGQRTAIVRYLTGSSEGQRQTYHWVRRWCKTHNQVRRYCRTQGKSVSNTSPSQGMVPVRHITRLRGRSDTHAGQRTVSVRHTISSGDGRCQTHCQFRGWPSSEKSPGQLGQSV